MDFLPLNSGFPAPPQTVRDVAEAILAQLDREAVERDRTPSASISAPRFVPTAAYGDFGSPMDGQFAAPYSSEESQSSSAAEATASGQPFSDPRNDNERIENILWLLKNNPIGSPVADNADDDATGNGIGNLFGLIGEAEAAEGGKKPPGKFDFRGPGIAGIVLRQIRNNAMRELYRRQRNLLRELEPNNPLLGPDPPQSEVPSEEEIARLGQEIDAARARAIQRSAPSAPRRGGETEDSIGGRAAHKVYTEDAKTKGDKANVPAGPGRADRIEMDAERQRALLKELKTNRPANIRRGERQGEGYAKAHEKKENTPTDWMVETYDLKEFWKWLLSQ